jgi:octaprenyl-diphosphate synthase
MSEGELLQLEKARRLDVNEQVYYEIIRQKTASLIASCCAVGAQSSGAGEEIIERMRLFGELVGQAFQIKDDLFDFEKNLNTGKPAGIDIKDSKMTLPLIHALGSASASEKRRIIGLIKGSRQKPEDVATVIKFVSESGGLKYASEAMNRFRNQALDILKEFSPGVYRQSLEQLVVFTTERRS